MIRVRDIAWAAGFIDGEGWFGANNKCLYIAVSQVQKEPLEWLQRLFGGRLYFEPTNNPRHQDIWTWKLCGKSAGGVMMTLYTLLSPKRQQKILSLVTEWRTWINSAYRTTCPQGHPLDSKNCRGHRRCSICLHAQWRAHDARTRAKRRAAKVAFGGLSSTLSLL